MEYDICTADAGQGAWRLISMASNCEQGNHYFERRDGHF